MKNATKTSSKKLVLNACTLALGAASAGCTRSGQTQHSCHLW